MTERKINSAWDLIGALMECAGEITGDQFLDYVVVNRGKGFVEAFQKEFPFQAMFISSLMKLKPDEILVQLVKIKPEASEIRFAKEFLAHLQKSLQPKP